MLVSAILQIRQICKEKNVKLEKFHCGGKGGQNVNKLEIGVRILHIPTRIMVTSTSERSQFANKKDALDKLNIILEQMEEDEKRKQRNLAWREHTRMVRGNLVRVFERMLLK